MGDGPAGARDLMGEGEVAGAYGITALPSSVLVGPDGRILAQTHDLRGERLAETLARLLPEG